VHEQLVRRVARKRRQRDTAARVVDGALLLRAEAEEVLMLDARARLERAAMELYLERGFEQATVADIAARAVSRS